MMSTTTEEILREEGAELALAELAERVHHAEESIKHVLTLPENRDRNWTIRELQDAAADGASSSVMSIAFLRLLQAEVLTVGSDLRVHAL